MNLFIKKFPDELMKQIKLLAIEQSTSAKKLIIKAVQEFLERKDGAK